MLYLLIFTTGLILTILLVYPVKLIAHKLGAVAVPGGRSVHSEPMPLMGGLAIYLTCALIALGVLVWCQWDLSRLPVSPPKLFGLILGATFLLFVGIVDDIKALRARWKLLGQLIAILIPVVFGFTIKAIQVPYVGNIQLGSFFGPALFTLWVLGITNAVNLTDGLDGLASVVCFFAALGNGIIGLAMGNAFIAFISFMLAGSLLGFLFHNFPPARIFLGDTGSMLLGFLLAVAVIESNTQKKTTTLLILAPLLLLGFSLLDVLLSVIRRFLRGKPIFSSDLGHIHHRLMARFRSSRRVLFLVACFSMFMVLVSIVTHFKDFISTPVLGFVSFCAVLITVFFVRLLGYFRVDRIRYVLESREDVKFFSSLLNYMRYSLHKARTQEDFLRELDWVCQALKPHNVTVLDSDSNILYCFVATPENLTARTSYRERLRSDEVSLEWCHSTLSDEPSMCDIRLMWRELFDMFVKHWHKIMLGEEQVFSISFTSEEQLDHLGLKPGNSKKSRLLSKSLSA